LWVPVPTDGAWQHVLDRRVVEAPAGWKLEKQPVSGAEMIVARAKVEGSVKVVVETTVVRQSPVFDLSAVVGETQATLFTPELRQDAELMSADQKIVEMARKAVADETNLARKVVKLLDAVADAADHYSKDPTKPNCGRGSAQDCMTNGGGCCTDLHSLFIAAARASGIPARMQFGYRLNAQKENTEYDPSYRCWIEYYLPGAGWVPTDIVVADSGERDARKESYGKLDARRVWLWEGRDLELVPKQSGAPIQTMLCGWAEIDGVPVDVLPAADGTPSKLGRKIVFQDLTAKTASK
jgi:transglutaminase-like putative cysteine protease